MAQAAQKQEEPKEERGLVKYTSRDGQEIRLSFDTIRRYLVSGRAEFVTDQEMIFFMGTCKARGLDPFKKDCYLVKYTERETAAIIVAIDYYRSRAKAQPDCTGWTCGIILKLPDGLEYRPGSFMLGDENLVGAWFRARPQNWSMDYEWSIPLAPYVKTTQQGAVTAFWAPEKQPYMICKVVESQGLRRVWPDEFQNLFIEEEIQARDVTPNSEPLAIPQPLEKKPEKKAEPKPTGAADLKAREEWVVQASLAELEANDNFALKDLKVLSQADQATICRIVTDRRRELNKQEKNPDA